MKNPLTHLDKYDIILASASPRRRELLAMLDIPFTVAEPRNIEETYPTDTPAMEVAPYLAKLKSCAYPPQGNQLVITADTVVVAPDGEVMGKPHSEQDAHTMLRRLAGAPHQVVTGLAVATTDKRKVTSCSTEVVFAPLTPEEIDFYITRCRPFDKAGAYGIQEWIGAAAVRSINGSYFNVMGLPIHRLYSLLRDEF
ncbi:MAG: Maf family nucleotide pyrophosphatase [Pseudoflavonifractor sp.]|nr:Maf family nucleotide pyrophosphatase [Alloprevotella sp.]MCM1116745.1 Maf family nucleotide pyrophosphatase [Pseudoflavonifractor sp.]